MPAKLQSDAQVAESITCILSDVDGVMTDGRLIYHSGGEETKAFHARDGLAIKMWMAAGFSFGIVTARKSPIIDRRSSELGIAHVAQGSDAKVEKAETLLGEIGCDLTNVCYIGDDLPDIPVMTRSGLAAAPADAATDAREAAQWVLRSRGGEGAVREVIERLMRAKGCWNAVA
ncbi:MAG: HAD hydrolase family protein [Planctomycetota bacterium]